MRKIAFFLAASASVLAAGTANAAPLIKAVVTGSGGSTVWSTDASTNNYTLFLSQVPGGVINPTNNFTSSPTTTGVNSYNIYGDGFPAGGQLNSDPSYTITLTFMGGATISGQYTGTLYSGGTSATAGGTTYTLTGFGWDRSPVDTVSPNTALTKGGDTADYSGQFGFSEVAAAVPEASTWAMMLVGFGMMGFGLRRRKSNVTTTVAFA